MKISEAQQTIKKFAVENNWDDTPNIDKFDHLHEELIEMSKLLRYKEVNDRKESIKTNKLLFEDGIGDLLFGTFRLANQLDIDAEEAFNKVKTEVSALLKVVGINPEKTNKELSKKDVDIAGGKGANLAEMASIRLPVPPGFIVSSFAYQTFVEKTKIQKSILKKLLPIMKGLLGRGKSKPLECVGTYAESRKAFRLSLEKARKSGKVPYLLR